MVRLVVGVLVMWVLIAGIGVDLLRGIPASVGAVAASFGAAAPAAAASTGPAATGGDSPANVRAIACDAYLAGWPAQDIPPAVAITFPESDGNDQSVQQGEPYADTGWGLWQITPGDSEPQIGTDSALLNPVTNARAALAKFEGAGDSFTPWTTYTGGEYAAYVPTVDADLSGFDYSSCGG